MFKTVPFTSIEKSQHGSTCFCVPLFSIVDKESYHPQQRFTSLVLKIFCQMKAFIWWWWWTGHKHVYVKDGLSKGLLLTTTYFEHLPGYLVILRLHVMNIKLDDKLFAINLMVYIVGLLSWYNLCMYMYIFKLAIAVKNFLKATKFKDFISSSWWAYTSFICFQGRYKCLDV